MAMRIGVIGCGNISDTYFRNGPLLKDIDYVACADLVPAAAAAKAAEFGLEALEIPALLARGDIDAVLNLTVPAAHGEVSLQVLEAGKHVFTEKPLALSLGEARAVLDLAAVKGLRAGAAPDTFLGPAQQEARAQIDAGAIGEVVTGLASVLSLGMEDWHPNPGFFYRKGGGPVLDMGPYYIASLVNLLGPVASVQATGRIGRRERLVTAEGPMQGRTIPVETFTTLNALLSFASGAEIAFLASWDVAAADLRPIELHGTGGSLRISDPNDFGGVIARAGTDGAFAGTATAARPFGADNRLWLGEYPFSCYRGLGLAEMARSIASGVPHRCSGEFALHVLEVMLAIESAAAAHRPVAIASRPERPAPLSPAEAAGFLAEAVPQDA
ncbi:Gfo/Idh/MocA family protein [Poseidonocella sp. HB161398]|uniref:Gfo/Idh/MocA family protein n=1 Tax=Poseidonocella sp. HB161398 TaxID=2320855 RepID=UPI001108671B|nr:Gfo/Idh/MocA family oxidoreductase [Poseidonocella sp. HB161398]